MADTTDNSQLCSILAYLLIGIIWFFADEKLRKNDLVKFHVKQSIVLFIFAICWSIVLGILGVALVFLWPIIFILHYVPLVFVIIGIIRAVNKQMVGLPLVGGFANRLTF
jgi:uncharacterized membrane protein